MTIIPVIVEVVATNPISPSLNPKLSANRSKVRGFDIVELKIANKPDIDDARKAFDKRIKGSNQPIYEKELRF